MNIYINKCIYKSIQIPIYKYTCVYIYKNL